MAEFITTIVALVLCFITFKNYNKGACLSYLSSVYLIPGHANVFGGIRFKFVVLGAMIVSAIINKIKVRTGNVLVKPAIFYFLYGLILAILSSYVPLTTQFPYLIKQWIYLFLFGILLWPALRTEFNVRYFLKFLYWALLFSTLMGILEYIMSMNLFREFFGSNSEIMFFDDERLGMAGRICVASSHPLDWGQCCIILLGASFLLFRDFLSQKKSIILFSLLIINCVLTGSRSSIFPIIILAALNILLYMKDRLRKYVWSVAIIFVGFVAVLNSIDSSMKESVMGIMMPWSSDAGKEANVGGSSVELREKQMENSLYFIGDKNLWVGMGYGLVHNRKEGDGDLFENAHGLESVVFVTVIEQGIVGLICFFIFYIFLYFSSLKYTQDCHIKIILFFLFLCYMISLLMTGIRSSMQLFFTMLVVFLRYEYIHNPLFEKR